jgi:polyisoprenoid-binding protein YceI
VAIAPGTYNLGPQNGKLLVKTGREGMGGKMGHDLVIEVTRWSATATVGEDPSQTSLTASAEAGSMEVVRGEGGVKPLTDGDKAEIKKTIVEKILGDTTIDFNSTSVTGGGSNATVQGDLSIGGKTAPAQFQLQDLGGGRIKATGTVVQSNHGIKPFKAFMGALKVKDPVEIEIEATVPES